MRVPPRTCSPFSPSRIPQRKGKKQRKTKVDGKRRKTDAKQIYPREEEVIKITDGQRKKVEMERNKVGWREREVSFLRPLSLSPPCKSLTKTKPITIHVIWELKKSLFFCLRWRRLFKGQFWDLHWGEVGRCTTSYGDTYLSSPPFPFVPLLPFLVVYFSSLSHKLLVQLGQPAIAPMNGWTDGWRWMPWEGRGHGLPSCLLPLGAVGWDEQHLLRWLHLPSSLGAVPVAMYLLSVDGRPAGGARPSVGAKLLFN